MAILWRHSTTVVWAILIAATCSSWWLGSEHGSASTSYATASVVILAVACIKMRLVGLYFMELKDAPFALRALFEGYVVGVWGLMVGLYWAL